MLRILIIEDDIDIQDILKNHLTDAGYEVVIADDGVAGIAKFDDTISLVLLDIMLPKIDGYGVCEVIRQKSQVPIINVTKENGESVHIGNYASSEELDRALNDAVDNGQLSQTEADAAHQQ